VSLIDDTQFIIEKAKFMDFFKIFFKKIFLKKKGKKPPPPPGGPLAAYFIQSQTGLLTPLLRP